MNKEMVLMIGLQGSGKSTYVNNKLAATHQVLCLDDIRLALGVEYSKRLEPVVRSTADIMARSIMERGLPIVVDGINTSIFIVRKYIDLAEEYKYSSVGIYLHIDSAICRKRRIGTKKITEEVIDRAEQNLYDLQQLGGFELFDKIYWAEWYIKNNTWNVEQLETLSTILEKYDA